MRRGTPAAEEFGKFLEDLRLKKQLSMRKVGLVLGAPAATVSQAERGLRAVKEYKLELWAKALEVDEGMLRRKWSALDKKYPVGPVVRRRKVSIKAKELGDLINDLRGPERERVRGYIEAIIENREV